MTHRHTSLTRRDFMRLGGAALAGGAVGAFLPTAVGAVAPGLAGAKSKSSRPWWELGILDDPVLDNQFLWYLSQVRYGMADTGECLDTAARIERGDPWSWPAEWSRTAERLRAVAEGAMARHHYVSAGEAYMRAATYYRAALIHHPEPSDAGVAATAREAATCFEEAIRLLGLPAQPVQVPYEGTTLPAYFWRSPLAGEHAPIIILHQGRDAWPEETMNVADGAMKRGYHCLQLHGPGQGLTIRTQGLPFRPDWERVITPAVDFALAQPGVDPQGVILMGLSMGGALAPRAAAFEKRVQICVANPGVLSWAEAILGHFADYPLLMKLLERGPAAFDAGVWNFFRLARAAGNDLMANGEWWLKDSMWKHGVDTPSAMIAELRKYDNTEIVKRITCKTLVMDGEAEEFSAGQAEKLYDALECEKEFMLFTAEDTGLVHCQTGAPSVAAARLFDWLDENL